MSDTTFLIIIALILLGPASWPMYRKFSENRPRERKKPEKYHLT